MLVQFKVQNFTSFNTCQTISLFSSTSTKENFNESNAFQVNKFGITSLLKSAAIFGANASGKSNFIKALHTLKIIILRSLTSADADNLGGIMPFFVKDKPFDIPTEFEISFIEDKILYRYGIAIADGVINEEWLYFTKESRETNLFHREKQFIQFNNRSFSEAKDFVRKYNDGRMIVDKTKENVPFVSVLAQFNGEKSRKIIEWFNKLNIVSGLQEIGFKNFTIELFEKDLIFKEWALKILSSLQIHDVIVVEEENEFSLPENSEDNNLNNAAHSLNEFLRRNKPKLKSKSLEIIKHSKESSKKFIIPFGFESTGTQKLIYLLGPLYDVINNNEILLVDEFDSKFHSLLTKFVIEIYRRNNKSNSQLIITCHDTNLLSKELFRRDQIWFIEKNESHESELYSLVEYKEHYTRRDDSYSKDYLSGKYGAIPLFNSIEELEMVLNEQKG